MEKDALAGVVMEATARWDVPLMVSRGTSSATFLYEAAQAAREAALQDHAAVTFVLALYDHDAAGARAARTVEEGLARYSGLGSLLAPQFQLLGVTKEQIDEWNLPSRPAKPSDPEAHKFAGEAVELDAIPSNKLISLVENAIVDLIDPDAWGDGGGRRGERAGDPRPDADRGQGVSADRRNGQRRPGALPPSALAEARRILNG